MKLTIEQALERCTNLFDESVEAVVLRLRESDSDDLLMRHAPDLLEVEWQALLGLTVRVGEGFRERADQLRSELVAVSVDPARRIVITPASQIRPRSVEWVWDGRVPAGGVSLLAGMGGLGKSTLMLEIAARLTRGELDGRHRDDPTSVLYATSEDAWPQVITPRLMAADADLKLVMSVEVEDAQLDFVTGFSMPEDLDILAGAVERSNCSLLVIDPLVAFVSNGVDAHRDHEVRRALGPLHQLAERMDIAVVGVVHLNKRESQSAAHRINGSVGFYNAARSVLLLTQAADDFDVRLLTHPKSNLGRQAVTLRYRIESADVRGEAGWINTSRATVLGESPDVAPDAGLAALLSPPDRSAVDEAIEFLEGELADGPVSAKVLFASAHDEGISETALKRAKRRLGIKSRKDGVNGGWRWSLPVGDGHETQGDHVDPLGHLAETNEEGVQEGQPMARREIDQLAPRSQRPGVTPVEVSSATQLQPSGSLMQQQFGIPAIIQILDGVDVLQGIDAEKNSAAAAVRLWNFGVDNPPGSQESGLCRCGREPTHDREDGYLECGRCLPGHSRHCVTEPFELVYP